MKRLWRKIKPKKLTVLMNPLFFDDQECRICFETGTRTDRLVSACKCKGTIKWYHQSCMQSWMKYSQSDTCRICQYKMTALCRVAPR